MKESGKRVVKGVRWGSVAQRQTIRTDVVLQAKELPASIPCLDPRLAHMDGDDFSLHTSR